MPRRKKPPVAENTGAVPYGQGAALANAQREIPVASPPGASPAPARAAGPPPAARAGGGGMAAAIEAAATMAPPTSGGLDAPTGRPGEPITAGLPIGAGAGPGALGVPLAPEDDVALRALLLAYQRSGSPALLRIIEVARNRSTARQKMLTQGRQVSAQSPSEFRRAL